MPRIIGMVSANQMMVPPERSRMHARDWANAA